VSENNEFVEKLAGLVEKYFGGSAKEVELKPEVEVIKALDEEERMALFVVLEPDAVDLHGDTYSEKEVEKACISYNQHCRKANLYHRVETEDFAIVQSWVSPNGSLMTKGVRLRKGLGLLGLSLRMKSFGRKLRKVTSKDLVLVAEQL